MSTRRGSVQDQGLQIASDTMIVHVTSTTVDSDSDGVPDSDDAFPDDPAASVDTDDDGMPDAWNPGYTAEDSTTGLELDDDPLTPNDAERGSDMLWIIMIIIIIVVAIVAIIGLKVMKGKKPDASQQQPMQGPQPGYEQPPPPPQNPPQYQQIPPPPPED